METVELRITKYSPALRDSYGRYLKDEWTSVSDVGKRFGNSVVTLEDYLIVENEYVSVIMQLMQAAGISELHIRKLNIIDTSCINLPTALQEESKSDLKLIRNANELDFDLVSKAIRLNLREVIACYLTGPRDFYVHFGYDYYMYAGFEGGLDELQDISTPLFIEPFISPYNSNECNVSVTIKKDADIARLNLSNIPSVGIPRTLECTDEIGKATIKLSFDKDGRIVYIEVSPANARFPLTLLKNTENSCVFGQYDLSRFDE